MEGSVASSHVTSAVCPLLSPDLFVVVAAAALFYAPRLRSNRSATARQKHSRSAAIISLTGNRDAGDRYVRDIRQISAALHKICPKRRGASVRREDGWRECCRCLLCFLPARTGPPAPLPERGTKRGALRTFLHRQRETPALSPPLSVQAAGHSVRQPGCFLLRLRLLHRGLRRIVCTPFFFFF